MFITTRQQADRVRTFTAARISSGDREDKGVSFWLYDDKENVVAVIPKSQVTSIERLGDE